MKKKSLGMIETWGIVGAVTAADAACKAANVEFIGYELNKAGFATVKFAGDVGSVRAAVSAGVAAAGGADKVVASHVIPRLAEGMVEYTFNSPDNVPPPPASTPLPKPEPTAGPVPAEEPKADGSAKTKESKKTKAKKKPAKAEAETKKEK